MDTVLDLELDDHTCARVPVVSRDVPMVSPARTVVVSGTVLDAVFNLAGLQGVVGFTAGMGRWIGPTLISVSAGVAGATCNPDLCGQTSSGGIRSGLAFPFSLESRSLLYVIDRRQPMFGMLTAGIRYSFTSVSLPTLDGDRRFALHSLYAVPGWWLLAVPRGPFPHGERSAHLELSSPVGVAFDPSASSRRFAFTLGLGFRFVFPI